MLSPYTGYIVLITVTVFLLIEEVKKSLENSFHKRQRERCALQ